MLVSFFWSWYFLNEKILQQEKNDRLVKLRKGSDQEGVRTLAEEVRHSSGFHLSAVIPGSTEYRRTFFMKSVSEDTDLCLL